MLSKHSREAAPNTFRFVLGPVTLLASVLCVGVGVFADTGQELAKYFPSDGESGDAFGYSVAISGSIVVVGAPSKDDLGLDAGAAYVFDTQAGTQLHRLLSQDPVTGRFGQSVATDGQIAVVGADQNSDQGLQSGAVYVFDVQSGAELMKLFGSDTDAGDELGGAVAVDGNIIVAGADGQDTNGFGSGAVYLFDKTTGAEIAKLLPIGGAAFDRFGQAVAMKGSIVAVGAPPADTAYLFDAGTGAQVAQFSAADTLPCDKFGAALSMDGSVVMVGAPNNAQNGTLSGAAYLFDSTTGAELVKLLASDGRPSDLFGSSVAIDGPIAAVGAYQTFNQGLKSGSTYLYDTHTNMELTEVVASDATSTSTFGFSVAVDGSLACVGDVGGDGAESISGAIYLFDSTSPAVPASTIIRNGGGGNPLVLTPVSDPVLGQNWDVDIDASGHAPSFAALAVYDNALSGVFLPQGELLVDPSGAAVFSALFFHFGGVVHSSQPVPADVSLYGASVAVQAFVAGAPASELTNALDLILGS